VNNTLRIQKYEEEIAVLHAKISRLYPSQASAFYVCSRCGLLYQSVWGCGCIAASRPKEPTVERKD
jgi:hypothetical protein